MARYALAIYHFFQKNKLLMWIVMLLSFAFFLFTGLQMRYEEDITRLLPQTPNENGESLVFSNLKVKDKVYIVFQPKADSVDVDKMSALCDEYMNTLQERDSSNQYIADMLYKVDQSVMMGALEYLMQCLPTYIEDEDYDAIDKLLEPQAVKESLQKDYELLYSPMGMMMVDLISRDPLGMKDAMLGKVSKMKEGLGGSYAMVNHHFFTPDSALCVSFLSPGFASTDSKKATKLVEEIENVIDDFQQIHPEVEIYYHGAPVQSVYNSRQTKKDLGSTLGISMLIICIAICFCFKTMDTLPMLLGPVIYGAFFALSTLYLLQGSMSLLALGIGGVVLGVALSYCLHVLVHYKYVSDPETVIKDQTTPVILGCLTTIGAFMSLMFTEADLLRDFGKFASLALVGTTFFSLVFLPHFFNKDKNKKNEKAFRLLEKINSYPFEKKTWLIISIVAISIICLFTMKWMKFDPDLKNIGYNEPRVIESQRLLADHSTKNCQTVYYATIDEDVDSALVFNNILYAELENQMTNNKIKSFGKSSSLFIPQEEQVRRINKWYEFWNGKEKRAEKLKVLMSAECTKYDFTIDMFDPFFELINKTYEPTALYDSDVLPSGLKSNMIEYTDGKYMLFTPVQMAPEDKNEVTDRIVKTKIHGKGRFVIIDPFYYTNELVKIVKHDFDIALWISSLFVFIVLLYSFRSLILALIGFVPMSLSWYILLGVMGIFDIKFNLINIVISTFIYGIGVDYSIFIMDGLLSGFRTKKPLLVYHKTAILFSAFVLIIGISSLIFATHPAMKSVGVATLIGMSATVIIAYSLQPFLFYWVIKRRTRKGLAPLTVYNIMHPKSFFRPDGMNSLQKLRNNYEYKGVDVENGLKKELHATSFYRAFIPELYSSESILDYGCGYGYISYWFAIKNDSLMVSAFDTNEDELTIARNCYMKSSQMDFTDSPNCIQNSYATLIVQKSIPEFDALLSGKFNTAHTVILRSAISGVFSQKLIEAGFNKATEDSMFEIWKK
ncbi:MAG: MMPL family transporter [Paludibacteraceae bacterium]|nr:MMPL family transporter [Paludibacteraceae bacterium]